MVSDEDTIDLSYWDDDPEYPVEDWKYEVSNDSTRLGYWEWVSASKDEVQGEAE